MASFKDLDPTLGANRGHETHGQPDMVVSMMTGSLLLGLLGTRAIASSLTQLGIASEELFRGERLPVLTLSDSASDPG
ncbi:hypothetical protein [Leptolyngbya sp. PCC 6406]|uniref:hypothetical protein n=1 Tax=Leptolyngbya sp. PCC 6406 TaxID=1173264 RepID=UPI0002AC5472|nr:hypothetical protein [Leptolyngbya sp. PCC 6406]